MRRRGRDSRHTLRRLVRRAIDGVEDTVEEAGKSAAKIVDRVEDAIERTFHPEHHGGEAHSHHHARSTHTDAGLTINIDVHCGCCPGGRHPGGGGRPGGGGPGGPGGSGGRPVHVTGGSDGSFSGGITGIGDVIDLMTRPPDVWPGSRSQLPLPLLFVRAKAGDMGARPVAGVFWESPDILIAAGVDPAHAPAVPDDLGGVARPNTDNTVYAHVWNLGPGRSPDTLVEFYWFNPALAFTGENAHFIGAKWVDLRARGERGSHKLVKCPQTWPAQYVNGGHECLLVRASQRPLDPLSGPAWDASQNRHIGQRNIHVMSPEEAAAKPTLPIAIGPLFGGVAQIGVTRADAATMPWLHLVTGRGGLPGTAAPTGDLGLTPPTPAGVPLPNLGAVADPRGAGLMGDGHGVTGDGQQVGFHATDGDPGAGNAHVYRVTGTQDGNVFGGYTVVVLGK